jgi:hypothetical protein
VVVAQTWIGNTPEIATKHYLTVIDEHFKMAAATDTQAGAC